VSMLQFILTWFPWTTGKVELSGTHFPPRPSVAVSFEQGSRLVCSGCSLSLTFPLTTIEETELSVRGSV